MLVDGAMAASLAPARVARSHAGRRAGLSYSDAGELEHGLAEHLGVPVDVGLGRRRRHERHVVERRQQDPAVQREEVHVALEREVARGVRLSPVPGSIRAEEVLGTAAEPGDVPRQARLLDARFDAGRPALGERDHPLERLVRQHLGERRAHGRERERVRRERPAHAPDVHVLELDAPGQAGGQLLGEPVRGGRDPAGDRLADRDDVRLEPVRAGVPARAAADRVGLVDREQRRRSGASARAARRGSPGSGWTMPMFVSAGSVSTSATSPCASSRSSAGTSLNSTTRVVSARSTGGPRLPLRARTTPSSSVANVSSTVPW